MLLEVCVDNTEGLLRAVAGGADRIELCAALAMGGLTPAPGLIAFAARQSIPSYAMIRPRIGDFVFNEDDIGVMLRDIDAVRAAGLAGVAIGANRADGALDVKFLERLVRQAEGLGMTLHRSFDFVPDFDEALAVAIELGFERILTSGGAKTAPEAADIITGLAERADGRISIMPGSGIVAETVGPFLDCPAIREVHGSCSEGTELPAGKTVSLGFSAPVLKQTSAVKVAALKTRISAPRI